MAQTQEQILDENKVLKREVKTQKKEISQLNKLLAEKEAEISSLRKFIGGKHEYT